MILEKINSPADVKAVDAKDIPALASEIRQKLIETVAENGGHLASSLCAVELTIALHRIFDSPKDKIIFDVGHQSYVHKLLTGRRENFGTLRKLGGIAGFPKMSESEHDAFGTGHASTSISAAAGIAAANKISGIDAFTVAVVGDGAFTGGMIYEALNNCADKEKLVIVLNDNDMSISVSVGGMSRYFSKFRSSAKYYRFKNGVKRFFAKIPLIGGFLIKFARKIKNGFKRLVLRENFFEQFGLNYYGPLDGNDEKLIELVLKEATEDGKCSVVHICTTKGKGYAPAEERPDLFHGVSGFDVSTGIIPKSEKESFSERFGKMMINYAEKDGRLAAITAAMPDGTGLSEFSKKFPDRFFDVGIAEEHAMTFGCGLAAAGMIPVFAVYSTFFQRAYDQLIHDAALQNLHIVVMLDRAGLVGSDGATHHGIFDIPMTLSVPNVKVFSPDSFDSLEACFKKAIDGEGVYIIRYPKGGENEYDAEFKALGKIDHFGNTGDKNVIISYGRETFEAVEAAKAHGNTAVIRLCELTDIDFDSIRKFTDKAEKIIVAEESVKIGGVGEKIAATLGKNVIIKAIDGVFPQHGSNKELYKILGIDAEAIEKELI